ncbi:MAG: Maf family protein [Wenzhouxiangellaceae bacterium]
MNEQAQAPATGANLVLASASPRRRELLSILIRGFAVVPADIDEQRRPDESAAGHVARLAGEKARRVAGDHPERYVLGSDTEVVLEDRCLGKPANADHAREMLESLSAREHEVISAVSLVAPGGAETRRICRTVVRFECMPGSWIERYIKSGEPMDKAGAYAIQGAAAAWISRIAGSYSAVVGLPLHETACLLREAGLVDR